MDWFKMLCLMMLVSLTAFAQNTITGKVIRRDSSAIVAANVEIIGTTIQGHTDVIGNFTIPVPDSLADKQMVLFVSKKGYLSTQMIIEGEYRQGKPITIMLPALGVKSAILPPTQSASLPPTQSVTPPAPTQSAPPPSPQPSPTQSATPPSSQPRDTAHANQPAGQTEWIPMFTWPPPEYSASAVLNKSYFSQSKTLFDVDDILTVALSELGYDDRSYFEIPDGFALVTRIEQINEDGTPFAMPARWSVTIKAYDSLNWDSYLKALIFPPSGFFRIIVFAVTNKPFTSSHKKPTKVGAEGWLKVGFSELPASIGDKGFGPSYRCTALIYEFKKMETDGAEQIKGSLTGTEHLKKSGLIPLVKEY